MHVTLHFDCIRVFILQYLQSFLLVYSVLVLIGLSSNEDSGKPVQMHSLAGYFVASTRCGCIWRLGTKLRLTSLDTSAHGRLKEVICTYWTLQYHGLALMRFAIHSLYWYINAHAHIRVRGTVPDAACLVFLAAPINVLITLFLL